LSTHHLGSVAPSGRCVMVRPLPSKQEMRVRFPPPAPAFQADEAGSIPAARSHPLYRPCQAPVTSGPSCLPAPWAATPMVAGDETRHDMAATTEQPTGQMKPAPGSAASEEREKSRRIGSLRALGPVSCALQGDAGRRLRRAGPDGGRFADHSAGGAPRGRRVRNVQRGASGPVFLCAAGRRGHLRRRCRAALLPRDAVGRARGRRHPQGRVRPHDRDEPGLLRAYHDR
jgi:hypothetical protein